MARSRRKTPIHGITTSRTEKDDKQLWHRRYRRAVRQAVFRGDEVMPHFRDVSNPWSMNKDGKAYWAYPTYVRWWWFSRWNKQTPEEYLRERQSWWHKMMRK